MVFASLELLLQNVQLHEGFYFWVQLLSLLRQFQSAEPQEVFAECDPEVIFLNLACFNGKFFVFRIEVELSHQAIEVGSFNFAGQLDRVINLTEQNVIELYTSFFHVLFEVHCVQLLFKKFNVGGVGTENLKETKSVEVGNS